MKIACMLWPLAALCISIAADLRWVDCLAHAENRRNCILRSPAALVHNGQIVQYAKSTLCAKNNAKRQTNKRANREQKMPATSTGKHIANTMHFIALK